MTSPEAPHIHPDQPLIVEPFFVESVPAALLVRDVPPYLATLAGRQMLAVRTEVLQDNGAPPDVLGRYNPKDAAEVGDQVRRVREASIGTHYVLASVGSPETVKAVTQLREDGLPVNPYEPEITIPEEFMEDPEVRAHLEKEIAARQAKRPNYEDSLTAVGLAKVRNTEQGVLIEAADVIPALRGRSIGSLMLYKALASYGSGTQESGLVLRARPQETSRGTTSMLVALGMMSEGQQGGMLSAPLDAVRQRLHSKLTARKLI